MLLTYLNTNTVIDTNNTKWITNKLCLNMNSITNQYLKKHVNKYSLLMLWFEFIRFRFLLHCNFANKPTNRSTQATSSLNRGVTCRNIFIKILDFRHLRRVEGRSPSLTIPNCQVWWSFVPLQNCTSKLKTRMSQYSRIVMVKTRVYISLQLQNWASIMRLAKSLGKITLFPFCQNHLRYSFAWYENGSNIYPKDILDVVKV